MRIEELLNVDRWLVPGWLCNFIVEVYEALLDIRLLGSCEEVRHFLQHDTKKRTLNSCVVVQAKMALVYIGCSSKKRYWTICLKLRRRSNHARYAWYIEQFVYNPKQVKKQDELRLFLQWALETKLSVARNSKFKARLEKPKELHYE